jgi:HK97 family phage portal protein
MAIFNIGGWSWPRRGIGASSGSNFTREPFWIGGGSRSGKAVTRETALQVSAILCGARVISQGIAQVPLKLYRETHEGGWSRREPARDHPLYRLIGEQPNDFQTSFSWRETMALHAVIGGDSYSFINRAADGKVREILPMAPDDVASRWDAEKSEMSYVFGAGPSRRELKASEVLHLHGPSWSGFNGMPALALASEAIGLSIAMRDSQSDLFVKGGRPSGILTKDSMLSPEASTTISAAWQERFGPNGKGGVALLDGGWKFTPMQMNAVDSQAVETMKFLIEEVARFLMVFPQMLMQADKPTYASVEQFFIAHVVYTLDPWMDRIEQELKRTLIGYEGENEFVYPRFVREGLLRGASRDRAEFYKAALGAGGSPPWMTQNEVRGLENLNPLDGGDVLLAPTTVQGAAPVGGDDIKESGNA